MMDPFTMAMLQQSIADQLASQAAPTATPQAPAPSGLAALATKKPPSEVIKMEGKGKDKWGKIDGEAHPKDPSYRWSSAAGHYVKVNPGSLR